MKTRQRTLRILVLQFPVYCVGQGACGTLS